MEAGYISFILHSPGYTVIQLPCITGEWQESLIRELSPAKAAETNKVWGYPALKN